MAAGLFKAPTSNYWSNSLNGAINDSVGTITLNDASGLQSPGYIVINREDGNGNPSPNAREIVSYTGISTNDLTGCTRGADNSTNRAHSDGALVEAVFTIGMHNDQRDAINAEHDTDGTHTIISATTITTANVATLNTDNVVASNVSVSTLGGDNVGGVRGHFAWTKSGSLATVRGAVATDSHFPLNRATQDLTINGFHAALTSAPSLELAQFDISWASGPTGDFTSIFSTLPLVAKGEYMNSATTPGTLSLTSLASGLVLRAEILQHGDSGGLTMQLPVTSRV